MRLPKISTLALLLATARDNYLLSPSQKKLRSSFAKARGERDAPIVLIQCVEDYFYFALFGKIASGLHARGPLQVHQYSLRSLREGSSRCWRSLFWNSVSSNWLSDWKWRRLYGAFADGTAYSATGAVSPWTSIRLWWTAWRLWRGLKTVDDLARLTVDGIWIGDLIIDSYIRFKPSPVPNLDDLYLLVIIRQALKDIVKAVRYFRKSRPALLLTSYTTYIQHGIPARVAIQQGILVRAFSNSQEMATAITAKSLCHTRDGKNYKRDFAALPDQAIKLAAAEQQLKDRLSGKIDAATSYMKRSAYGRATEADVNVRGMPVIFLHDFYDSVHVYQWICFHDFWSWISFTVETLRAANIAFAVKPHPNQVANSSDALDMLLAKYPDMNVLSSNITNNQLVRSGMSCAVTVYGTVASEMAFMGVPTISCGDNPHVSFDFCHTARTQQEYEKLLLNHDKLPGVPDEMRQESCAFYYMHNLNLDPEQKTLRDGIMELRRRLLHVDTTPSPQEIIHAAEDFSSAPEIQAFCASLYDMMQGRRRPGGATSRSPNPILQNRRRD